MLGHKVHVNLLTFSIKKVKWLLGAGEPFLHLEKKEYPIRFSLETRCIRLYLATCLERDIARFAHDTRYE